MSLMGRGIEEEALVLLHRRLCDLNFIFSLFSDSPDINYSKLKFIVSNSVTEAVTIRYCLWVLEDTEKLRYVLPYVVELQRRLKATGVGVVWQSEGAKLNSRMGNSNRSLGYLCMVFRVFKTTFH
ncbi:hypothetical protein Lser_V15G33956 [Lactuca serriola]